MKKLVIIDLNNFIYRAFFGIQQPLKTPEGVLVNAVYGTFNMIHRIMTEIKPDYIVAALDSKTSKRKEEYAEYKSTRSKMPDDLRHQIPMIHELIKAMGIQTVIEDGLEADDLICTICKHEEVNFDRIFIASGDKDLMQLVNEKVFIYDSMKQIIYERANVIEKFGVAPEQIVDYLSIVGDSSDCIPGVKGIGEKGAVKLLKQYGSLENIYNHMDAISPAGLKDKLTNGRFSAFLSQNLARLRMANSKPELIPFVLDKEKAKETLSKWNMKTAINKINEI